MSADSPKVQRVTIKILTSCTSKKQKTHPAQLQQADFSDSTRLEAREKQFADDLIPAEKMYTGQQHKRLMEGIVEASSHIDIDLHIISAGYGVIEGNKPIAPYECTFTGMKAGEIVEWSNTIGIPERARDFFKTPADLCFVLLGESYLRALQLTDDVTFDTPTIFFTGMGGARFIKGQGDFKKVILNNAHAKRLRCGVVSLKGELTRRFLSELAHDRINHKAYFIEGSADWLEDFFTHMERLNPSPRKTVLPTANPAVDEIITLTPEWTARQETERVKFFIPDWEDHVDPDYDFINDRHSHGRGNRSNQSYAHQIYEGNPNYSGILVSKAVIESSPLRKQQIKDQGGIHGYLRVPIGFPVMGDCGAFSYVNQETPPYTTAEIVEYYSEFGFNYGVSIDHLVFGATTEAGRNKRYDLTIENAREFIRLHRAHNPEWIPIGAVQGWSPETYANAAKAYVEMEYKYIGIGGLVRAKTGEIFAILEAIRKAITKPVKIHLFGVARPELISRAEEYGLTSVDSASYLRQAWMRMGQNYATENGAYAAIRIPEAARILSSKKGEGLDTKAVTDAEREALACLRAYHKEDCSLEDCLEAVMRYAEALNMPQLDRLRKLYHETLLERPWEKCECAICQKIGIDVIIFRGNNRNRRRGFHNNYVFYQKILPAVFSGEDVNPNWNTAPSKSAVRQPKLTNFKG